MRLRTQLALIFFLLAVVPLSVIVSYSYVASMRALRQAEQEETTLLVEQMSGRLERSKRDLAARFAGLSRLPFQALIQSEGEALDPWLRSQAASMLGDAAGWVEEIEVIAELPESPGDPSASAPVAPAPEIGSIRLRMDPKGIPSEEELSEEVAAALLFAESMFEPPEEGAPSPGGSASDMAGRTRRFVRSLEERLQALGTRTSPEEARVLTHKIERLLGDEIGELGFPIELGGETVGRVEARVKEKVLLTNVLERTPRSRGEIPYAIDASGKLHVLDEEDRPIVEALCEEDEDPGWVVATTERDPESGLTLGIARPVSESLAELRRTSIRNLGFGFALIGLCLLGIMPLSRRLTHTLSELTDGAERLARGEPDVQVPVRSRNELGRLARVFNRMSSDLRENQQLLLEEERLRKEQELQQHLLEAENRRKDGELDEARRFQLSLLPKRLPDHPHLGLAVSMKTAAEVGGDYYDFHLGRDGVLTAAIGDATGHGARAGTMVTAIKSLFTAHADELAPTRFLRDAAATIKRMELGRMAMALAILRLDGKRLTVANAGMPPLLIYRAGRDAVEEIAIEGMPLGGVADFVYREESVELEVGDVLLLTTDGLPELLDPAGEPLGYPRVREIFRRAAGREPTEIIEEIGRESAEWSGAEPLHDDVTLVVMQYC